MAVVRGARISKRSVKRKKEKKKKDSPSQVNFTVQVHSNRHKHIVPHGTAVLQLSQSIVLGASRDSVLRPISASMPLRRFLLADRLAPEALRPLASQLLFGDPLREIERLMMIIVVLLVY